MPSNADDAKHIAKERVPVSVPACPTISTSKSILSTIHSSSCNNIPTSATSTVDDATPDDLWVFGYGSLVWKVDFPVVESQTGYIKGFQRRFYQHSIDHRGTPEKPGRVVTLIAGDANAESSPPESRVYGVAHRIAHDQRDTVIAHLDHREKNGYERHTVDFYPYPSPAHQSAAQHRSICVYLATADNESFAGPLEMPQLARQVFEACGPSGPNCEYVYRLADAMRFLFPDERDEHLFELERTLRTLELEHKHTESLQQE